MHLSYVILLIIAVLIVIYITILILRSEIFRYLRFKSLSVGQFRKLDLLYADKERVNSADRVIVSLTTIPSRLSSLHRVLASLLDQTKRVDDIYLCIPHSMKRTGEQYIIPDHLKNLHSIKIIRCPDKGPVTKLLPTLRRESKDTKIIYLDDDRIYGTSLIDALVNESNLYPDQAICNFGWKLPTDHNYLTHRGNLIFTYLFKFGDVDIMEGCEGCLVKPRFFTREVFENRNTPKEVFFVDDIWISGNLAKNKIKRRRMPFLLKSRCYSIMPEGESLMQLNQSGVNNNRAIEYFSAHW